MYDSRLNLSFPASGDAKVPTLSSYLAQVDGFGTANEARDFALRVFPTRAAFTWFLSADLNPLSLKRHDAPKLEQELNPWD